MPMKNKGSLNLRLFIPKDEESLAYFLTQNGTYKDCDLLVNKDGVYQSEVEAVVEGLVYLHHQKHIIHTDLKPSNLLINHRGEVKKITDFGFSTFVQSTSAEASSKVGTFLYMSPEKFSEKSYGYKSDIWALGLVMLECATGQFPYALQDEGEGWMNYFSIMQTIVEQPPPCASPDQFSSEFCSFISSWSIPSLVRMKIWKLILHHTSPKLDLPSQPCKKFRAEIL